MKKELIEFLIKRIGKKIDDVDEFLLHENFDTLEKTLDDLHLYWAEIKTILLEVIS